MSYVITICSGKGGTGKTSTAINLAAALMEFGKNILLVDANLTAPNLGLNLGLSKVPITLHDVLKGKCHASEAVYVHASGLKIVPASIALKDIKDVNTTQLRPALEDLKKEAEIVIVDSAPGLSKDVVNTIKHSDEIIVVTNPDLASVTEALRTIKVAENFKVPVRGVVLTRVRNDKLELSQQAIEKLLGKKILAVVPEDNAVRSALVKKESVVEAHPESKAALQYKLLAAKILGKKFQVPEKKSRLLKIVRFFGLGK